MLKLKIGDRVKLGKDCYKYNITPYGTIIGISTSGWSDVGGIYKLELDDGNRFNCSEDAIVQVVGKMKVIEKPWKTGHCDKCVCCFQEMCSAYTLYSSWWPCSRINQCTKFKERKNK
jgi:hypothetical protein